MRYIGISCVGPFIQGYNYARIQNVTLPLLNQYVQLYCVLHCAVLWLICCVCGILNLFEGSLSELKSPILSIECGLHVTLCPFKVTLNCCVAVWIQCCIVVLIECVFVPS